MRINPFLVFLSFLFVVSSCAKENVQVAEESKQLSFQDINLQEGLSKWLPEEQRTRFSKEELAELDDLLMYDQLPKEVESRTTVEVPAESQDALQAAIEQAGEGGTVLLKAGDHFESSPVTITQQVTIRGEEGAVLITDVAATSLAAPVQPAFHILNANNVAIIDLTIRPSVDIGGTGILVENSERAFLVRNDLDQFEFGILMEQADFARIVNNKINTTAAWTTGEIIVAHALTVINGQQTRLIGNQLSGAFSGSWTCDANGLFLGNTMTGNFIGNILCNVPPSTFIMPDGRAVGSNQPGTNWLTLYNNATGNLDAGYLIIDGANNNFLAGNAAGNNGTYDFDFTTETDRFGFFIPGSFDNRAIIGNEYTVKDCGVNNDITGGIMIDTSVDPCF